MKNKHISTLLFLITLGAIIFNSCGSFLDEKPDRSMLIPNSLSDLQALLDNSQFMNLGYYSGLLEVGTDDFVLKPDVYGNLPDFEKKIYIWDPSYQYLPLGTTTFWKNPYFPVLIANTVLEELDNMNDENHRRLEEVRGSALFFRAYSFFMLSLVYGQEYALDKEPSGMGIPLRLTADFTVKSERATMVQTMQRIIADLVESLKLLPHKSDFATQPTITAAHALLARVLLYTGDYDEASRHADAALKYYDKLIDYETIDPSNPLPFEIMHEEIIFYAYSDGSTLLTPDRAQASEELVNSYTVQDHRKNVFFHLSAEDQFTFKGSYSGMLGGTFFVGLATDELYLILAECLARSGDTAQSNVVLKKLLDKRYITYNIPDQENTDQLLRRILLERRKELVMRGLRWYDLRRLNQDNRFAKTITKRTYINGVEKSFSLPPRDAGYAFQIPHEVIRTSDIEQNPKK